MQNAAMRHFAICCHDMLFYLFAAFYCSRPAFMAHGDIAVVSAYENLTARGYHMTFGINSRIDYSLCAAGADGFYFRYRIGNLKKPPASGKKMRHEVCAQSEAKHGNIAEIYYLAQLVYLFRSEKLAFVRYYDINPAHFIEQGDYALLMRDDIRLCRETYT